LLLNNVLLTKLYRGEMSVELGQSYMKFVATIVAFGHKLYDNL